MKEQSIGQVMHQWAEDLFPINRSITGEGVRKTLRYIQEILHGLEIKSVPTGYKAFDWTVPDEWNVSEAFIEDDDGNIIVDFKNNNLHLVGYSEPVDKWVNFEELDKHLYSLPSQPDAIPYITSYYSRRWGFCLTHNQRLSLDRLRKYRVVINSELQPGFLNYGELIIPGKQKKEILLSTYVCHPSMVNNELSGPVVTMAIANWLLSLDRQYTYRVIFIPETIGSIVYLSQHWREMKANTLAGFVLTCIGDDENYSILRSRIGNTFADKVATYAASIIDKNFIEYSYVERGSDERQYCSPGIDLPVCCLMRTKFGEFPEYHTSLDNLQLVTAEGLQGGYDLVKEALEGIELNRKFKVQVMCEPQLGKRGLYPNVSTKDTFDKIKLISNLIAYSDGNYDLIDIARKLDCRVSELFELANPLLKNGLLEEMDVI